MRAYVADDAPIPFALKEPGWPFLRGHSMRSQPDRLDDVANRSGFDKLPGSDRRPVFQPLAIHDRIYTAGLCLNAPHLGELFESRDAWFVGHEVFAVPHDPDTKRGAVSRYRRADYELDRGIL